MAIFDTFVSVALLYSEKMRITYIFRRQGYSIEKVFNPIIAEMKRQGHDVSIETVCHKKSLIMTLAYNMWHFARLSNHNICHITGDIQYVACFMNPKKTVMTIHDMVSLHNPAVPWYSRILCYWLWYYFPLKRLKYITCISEATRQDVIKTFPWAEKKLIVIGNPVSDEYKYYPKGLNLAKPRILHIGTKTNKNLNRVIQALNGIQCHLRIIGIMTDDNRHYLKEYGIDFSNVSGLSDDEILQEYINADIVSFLSLFEGFGMPIIEAQAVGRPVVTSNIEPMVTVSGEAAALVDPYNVTSIHDGFMSLIDSELKRTDCIKKGLNNVRRYSIHNICYLYITLYQSL